MLRGGTPGGQNFPDSCLVMMAKQMSICVSAYLRQEQDLHQGLSGKCGNGCTF